MQEAFLHYLWRHQKLKFGPWQTTSGEAIQVVKRGFPNTLGGPDFKEAQIRLGETLWAGQVELHLRASDWYKHRHHQDPAYRNVVLHVVYEEDQIVYRSNGARLPCLELKGRFDEGLYERYSQLMAEERPIACAPHFATAPEILKLEMLDRMALARLEQKSQFLEDLYRQSKGDWESCFYWALAYSLGLKENTLEMLRLAQLLPLKLWRPIAKPRALEALFLGAAGFLDKADPAFAEHQRDWQFLRHKYRIEPPHINWQYGGIRPAAFPDRRIALLGKILAAESNWHRKVLSTEPAELSDLFKFSLPETWTHHYRCGQKSSKKIPLAMAKSLREKLIINLVVPYWFFYGSKTGRPDFKEKALAGWAAMDPELNKIVSLYEQLGLTIRSALDSQAVLQWHNSLCGAKKCLNCALGNNLLKG